VVSKRAPGAPWALGVLRDASRIVGGLTSSFRAGSGPHGFTGISRYVQRPGYAGCPFRYPPCAGFPTCSGSTIVGVGLTNGDRFGLTLCDNGLGGRLTFSANGLSLADNGLANGATGSRLLTIDDSDLRMGQCQQPAIQRRWKLVARRPLSARTGPLSMQASCGTFPEGSR
jgi:hypothetical protein